MNDDQQLADDDAPFTPPEDAEDEEYEGHPATDGEIDSHELYDEGLAGAAEKRDREDPVVLKYHPPDEKKDENTNS
jgi:hypothetical protein